MAEAARQLPSSLLKLAEAFPKASPRLRQSEGASVTPPKRDTPAGHAHNGPRNLAHRDGRDPGEYVTLYALEGFLTRLAGSAQADDFVLKGGVLMAAFAARRPTRDIDLAAVHVSNEDLGSAKKGLYNVRIIGHT